MKLLKWLTIAGCCFGISGCMMNEEAVVYPEVEPCEVVWINGASYYYVSPGIYYQVIIRGGGYNGGGYRYWGTRPAPPIHRVPSQPHYGGSGHGPHFPSAPHRFRGSLRH
jgi:hypothetical protein